MKYKLPPLPSTHEVVDGLWEEVQGPYDKEDMRQYAEQAVAPLLAEIERLNYTVDALLSHCPHAECIDCSKAVCPDGDALHFHHDGCPSCEQKG